MANWYVSATASGGGAGSEVDPFTIAEAFAKSNYAARDRVYIKAGTYTISAVLDASDTYVGFIGYNSTIGDLDDTWGETNKPVIQVQAASGVTNVIDLSTSSTNVYLMNLVINGTNGNGYCVKGGGATTKVINCVVKNATTSGLYNCQGCVNNITTGCQDGFDACLYPINCLAKSNTRYGFVGGSVYVNCVAYGNGSQGFNGTTTYSVNCTAVGNTSYGFRGYGVCVNCIVEDNTGAAYSNGDTSTDLHLINCNQWNSGASSSQVYEINADTTDPALTNPAADDFTPGENMAGKGAYIGDLDASGALDLGAIQIPTTAIVAPTFAGISQLEAVGAGCLRASWSAATGTCTGYNVYVRVGSSTDLFTATYFKCKIDSSSTEVYLRTAADNTTFFTTASGAVYVGVRAENSGTEETNTTSLNVTPIGDGASPMRQIVEGVII